VPSSAQPNLTVLSTMTGYNTSVRQRALEIDFLGETAPDYCNQTSAAHWDYGPEMVWLSPQCAAHLELPEFSDSTADEVWVYTNFVQRIRQRTCQFPATMANITLVDPVEASRLMVTPFNCTVSTVAYHNVFIYEPETVYFELTPTYSTSWVNGMKFDSLTLMSPKGVPLGSKYVFHHKMRVTLADLLAAAGLDLDTQNVDSGGLGLYAGAASSDDNGNSATTWPTYRNTGVSLRAKVAMSNFRAKKPVNFNVTGEVHIEVASEGAWNFAPLVVNYWGAADETYDSKWLERRMQGVRIHFVPEGVLGAVDGLTTLNAIINIFVVVGISVAVTDCAGQYVSESFSAEKYDDNGERQALDTLLEKEAVRTCVCVITPAMHIPPPLFLPLSHFRSSAPPLFRSRATLPGPRRAV
jgi:hypothetical protein